MAQNDIYGSEQIYLRFKENLPALLKAPDKRDKNKKYYCKNADNLQHFKTLIRKFEAMDVSFVRRVRLLNVLKIATYGIDKPFTEATREDIDLLVAYANEHMSAKTACDFRKELKLIWKHILPENDEKGRADETVVPYVVRHLKNSMDKSRQVTRKDKMSFEQFEQLVQYFSKKPCLQAYLMVAYETLARPQELLWRRIKDVEVKDNYATILLSDHGKEGTGVLHCIDSLIYLKQWLNVHPYRNKPDAFLFTTEKGEQYQPPTLNKHLRNACKRLKIPHVTCYSIKRNGVTIRRLRGDTDVEIQKIARWTSTRQLKAYDLSNQHDVLKMQLIKRGLLPADQDTQKDIPQNRQCVFCHQWSKFTDQTCKNCGRLLDRKKAEQLEYEREAKLLRDFITQNEVKEMLRDFIKSEISKMQLSRKA